jgi:hypothetical protein
VSVNNDQLQVGRLDLDDYSVDQYFNYVCYLNTWTGNIWGPARYRRRRGRRHRHRTLDHQRRHPRQRPAGKTVTGAITATGDSCAGAFPEDTGPEISGNRK